jgi:membrane protease YdiL (CAAX protease family)
LPEAGPDQTITSDRRHSLLFFFVIAYAISWPLFILAGVTKLSWITLPGLFGPALAGIIMANASHGKAGVRKLLGRITVWRFSPLWYAFAFLFPSAAWALSAFVSSATTGSPTYSPTSQWYLILPVFIGLFVVVIGEEVGWRGFALPALQKRWSALVSSVILAIPWAVWHFAIMTNPAAPNVGSVATLAFIPEVFALSIILTVVFNNTRGSLLSVLIYHASGDTAGFFINESTTGYDINVAITVIVALALVFALGPKHLSRSGETSAA